MNRLQEKLQKVLELGLDYSEISMYTGANRKTIERWVEGFSRPNNRMEKLLIRWLDRRVKYLSKRPRNPKIYIVQAYSYEELYIVYITKIKSKALKMGKELVKNKDEKRSMWFRVVEAEFEKSYAPGIAPDFFEEPKQIWDEHDDL